MKLILLLFHLTDASDICPKCKGTGKYNGERCLKCDGTGKYYNPFLNYY